VAHQLYLCLLMTLIGAAPASGAAQAGKAPDALASAPISVRYTDVRQAAGITFVQDSTQTDEKYYLETMGTGVGWIDYDQDGLMDLYFG
jgi:enediyne biosynthesis protein E4